MQQIHIMRFLQQVYLSRSEAFLLIWFQRVSPSSLESSLLQKIAALVLTSHRQKDPEENLLAQNLHTTPEPQCEVKPENIQCPITCKFMQTTNSRDPLGGPWPHKECHGGKPWDPVGFPEGFWQTA